MFIYIHIDQVPIDRPSVRYMGPNSENADADGDDDNNSSTVTTKTAVVII